MWQTIALLYVMVGLAIVLLTRARGVIEQSMDAVPANRYPFWKVATFQIVLHLSSVALWPVFLGSWFAKANAKSDATRPNAIWEKEASVGFFNLFGKRGSESKSVDSEFAETLGDLKKLLSFSPLDVGEQLPNGYGEFGLTPTNPIPLAFNEPDTPYLSLLRTDFGKPIDWEIVEHLDTDVIPRAIRDAAPNNKAIDKLNIFVDGSDVATLFSCPYFARDSKMAPRGFQLSGPRTQSIGDSADLQLRWLRFPETSVGTVEIWNDTHVGELDACSGVQIPEGMSAALTIEQYPDDLSFLRDCSASVLDSLSFRYLRIKDSELSHIQHLTSLRNLDLNDSGIGDAALGHVKNLNEIRTLDLGHTRVTAVGVSYLSSMKQLRSLNLKNTAITDEAIKYLARITTLESLDLSCTRITDAGLIHLKALKELRTLDLSDTSVSDSGLFYLAGQAHLTELTLSGAPITDFGIAYIGHLRSLTNLDLYQTKITDSGLPHLSHLTNLTRLILTETEITDAGLRFLENLSQLTFLSINCPKVTDQGKEQLRKLLLTCKIP